MNVIVTVVVIVAIAMWAMAVYGRLVRLRKQVTQAWKRLEADQANQAIKSVYNKHVTIYNEALASFPAYLVAPLAGLKPANPFK